MRRIVIVGIALLLLFLAGCIRDRNSIMQEDCNSYSGMQRDNCLLYKSYFIALQGDKEEAINNCKEILGEDPESTIDATSSAISLKVYFRYQKYKNCIERVAVFSKDDRVCEWIDKPKIKNIFINFQTGVNLALDFIGGLSPGEFIQNEVERCKKKVYYEANLKNSLAKNIERYVISPS